MLFVLAISCLAASAQNLQEVVYLKNGSIIRGVIIEQVPNKSIKIQTADGSVFVYRMDEVEKITKEAPKTTTTTAPSANYYTTSNSSARYYNAADDDDDNEWRTRGYRGFVDVSNGLDCANGDYAFELTTTHGFQINPRIFVGGGIGLGVYLYRENVALPFFADFRFTFLKSRITPYIDVKAGYSPIPDTGAYFSPTVGCHFSFKEKFGMNVGLGYTMQEYYRSRYYGSDLYHCLQFRVGLEW